MSTILCEYMHQNFTTVVTPSVSDVCNQLHSKKEYDEHVAKCSSLFTCMDCNVKFSTKDEIGKHLCKC